MTYFNINDSVAIVTGTNKKSGIGRAIVHALLKNGAAKVYATARDMSQLDDLVQQYNGKVVPVSLDVTDIESIGALSDLYPDVNLIVNNAGYVAFQNTLDSIAAAEKEIKVNYYAPMAIVKSFAPNFERRNQQAHENNGSNSAPTAVVNVNSIVSFVNFHDHATYSASKAAAHSLTQAQRRDLAAFNTLVMGVYPFPIDTDMAEKITGDKTAPSDVADRIVEGLMQGQEDVFPDPFSVSMYQEWKADNKALERRMAVKA